MALLSNWWSVDVTALLVSLLVGLYLYFTIVFNYWAKRGVPFLKPTFPLGNMGGLLIGRRQFGIVCSEFYNQLAGHKYGGIFRIHRPALILRDLDVIKNVLVKDFASFQGRGIYFNENTDPILAHLFRLDGKKWKNMRVKLTPTFTSGKMKMMYDTILSCGHELSGFLKHRADVGEVIEVKDVIARFSTDVIASCAFGIQCNCLKDPDAEFRRMGKAFFKRDFIDSLGGTLGFFVPAIAAILNISEVPKKISTFFRKIVKETVEYREKNDVTRRDFMQLLIQLKNEGFVNHDDGSTDEATTGQGNSNKSSVCK